MHPLPRDITASKAEKIGIVIDHLVSALGSEPGCTMRRAVILTDISQYPDTTQAEIIDRLGANKSALNRDIEWLYDYGCIMRTPSGQDGRNIHLQICGYSKTNLDLALESFDSDHISLKNFLIQFINQFGSHKATLRDAKIIATVSDKRVASRQDIFEDLYSGPSTTDNRAINNLVDIGFVRRLDETDV